MTIANEQVKLDVFKSLFSGRKDVYGRHDPGTKKSWQEKASVTDNVFLQHLFGKRPCGIYLLKENNTCSAVTVDFDKPDKMPVIESLKRSNELGLFAYPEISKSKGWHVWIFFDAEVQAAKPRKIVRHILREMGLDKIVEVFPKQDYLNNDKFYGNFINLPLANVYVAKGRAVFVDQDLQPILDQWQFLEQIKRVPGSVLDSIIIRLAGNLAESSSLTPETNFPPDSKPKDSTRKTFGLLPCAVRMLKEGVTENQRISAFRLAVNLKKTGLPMNSAVSVLMEWRKKNRPANGKRIITPEEINEKIRAAYARQYAGCGCNDEVMQRYCDEDCVLKRNMRTRKI